MVFMNARTYRTSIRSARSDALEEISVGQAQRQLSCSAAAGAELCSRALPHAQEDGWDFGGLGRNFLSRRATAFSLLSSRIEIRFGVSLFEARSRRRFSSSLLHGRDLFLSILHSTELAEQSAQAETMYHVAPHSALRGGESPAMSPFDESALEPEAGTE